MSDHPLLWLGAGAGALWWYQRHRRAEQARHLEDHDERWGAEHGEPDERDVAPTDHTTPVAAPAAARVTNTTVSSKALSHAYDATFRLYGSSLPVPYLRALAARESGLDPHAPKGLITVVRVALEDFNARQGTNLAPKDLTNPTTSVMIAGDTLHRIIASFAANHPEVENLREDWSNRDFVELLTFAWNAGYSESSGLGRVVRYLVDKGQTEITLADVVKNAYAAGAKHWLWDPAKARWSRSVADLYFAELARDVAAGRVKLPIAPSVTTATPRSSEAPSSTPIAHTEVVAFDFGRPVPAEVKAIVSSGWSRPRGSRAHRALDIPVPLGTRVLAIDDGVVTHVRTDAASDAGLWVAVQHPSRLTSRYLHLSRVHVALGARVHRGDLLALSGNTGNSTGPHLHLDLRVPATMLPAIAAAIGTPANGWGDELAPYGFSIPGEPWVPVDGYRQIVVREAAAAGVPLYAAVAPATTPDTTIALDEPVSSPSQIDPPPATPATDTAGG